MTKMYSVDQELLRRRLVTSRHQAVSYIRLGYVRVDGKVVTQTDLRISQTALLEVAIDKQYVSRAGLKLALALKQLRLSFAGKVVLDVGSSTGGFSQVALEHGALRVIAVEIGSDQMNPKLLLDPRLELHEKTDIRSIKALSSKPDLVVVDVSFVSLREILPFVRKLVSRYAEIVVLVKPQFEVIDSSLMHKGIIKNDRVRREILADFEQWAKQFFVLEAKADSTVPGSKGNVERFYKLR